MNHIKELKKEISRLSKLKKEAKAKLENLSKPKHKIGGWYKHESGSIFCVTSINDEGSLYGYGVDGKGDWFEHTDVSSGYKCACNDVAKDYTTEATPQEVEEALIKEAKRRYKVGDKLSVVHFDCSKGHRIFNHSLEHQEGHCDLWIKDIDGYQSCIFKDGKWAYIIEQDKFAELKEAHKNGAVIQILSKKRKSGWHNVVNKDSLWREEYEYRIKPAPKPKVGDVCKFWDDDESIFMIGKITEIDTDGHHWIGMRCFPETKPLTQQEVINLLFNK